MDTQLFELLLCEGESNALDYKRDQYPFVGATDDEKAELLKDILAFGNSFKEKEGYILIGVQDVKSSQAVVYGIASHLQDADLQQFMKAKTNKIIQFLYSKFTYDAKDIGIITIFKQSAERPFYLNKDFGKLKKGIVYYRQGSSTAEATPEVIKAMGIAAAKPDHSLTERIEVRTEVAITDEGKLHHIEIVNPTLHPVNLRSVNFHWDDGQPRELFLFTAIEVYLIDGRIRYQGSNTREYELQGRKSVRYYLRQFESHKLKAIAGQAEDKMYISIRSHTTELYRMVGQELKEYLSMLVKEWEEHDMKCKPRYVSIEFYHNKSNRPGMPGHAKRAKAERKGVISFSWIDYQYKREIIDTRIMEHVTIMPKDKEEVLQDVMNGKTEGVAGSLSWFIKK